MSQDDPLPETKKPVLIVSDGEKGNLVEKVIVEKNNTTSAQPPKSTTNATHSDDGDNPLPDEKGK